MNMNKLWNFIKLKKKILYVLLVIVFLLLFFKYANVPNIPNVNLFEKSTSGFSNNEGISLFSTASGSGVRTSGGMTSGGSFSDSNSIDRKVIKTASIEIEVKDFLTELDNIIALTNDYNGFVTSSSVRVENNAKIGDLIIRVPADKFYVILSDIETKGEVKSKKVSGQDVTEEYIDLQARLDNAKVTEQRLLEILKKAETVDDILKIEGELNGVRERIEQLSGRITYLENSVDLATININIHEPMPTIKRSSWFTDSLKQALESLVNSFSRIIVLFGVLIPYIVLLTIGYGIYKIIKRRY